jgi:uncharacterized membrane protein
MLSLAGFLISFYLALTHFRGVALPCYVTSGCEAVVTSRYATVAGAPISLAGMFYFAAMFYLTIGMATSSRPLVARAYAGLADLGALVAITLFLLQAVVLEAYCVYCLITEVIALLLWAGSLLLGLRRQSRPQEAGA